ncbi:MAG: multicomponent Na+:H+ antiporter subunit [Thermosediminibacterales bacterium]|nr:multicomponent Na+:H+ antiporter subunit [Thermosediminibacterales bacterium]
MGISIHLPVVIILILLFSSVITSLLKNRNYFVSILTTTVLFICFLMSIVLVIGVYQKGPFNYQIGGWNAPWGIELVIDDLAVFMATVILGISFLVAVYSLNSIYKEIKEKRINLYYSFIMLLVGAMLGITYTGDLFNLFVFIEISSISACAIISIKDKKEPIEATVKYLVLSSLGSGAFLFATALIYGITGNLNIDYIHEELLLVVSNYPMIILVALSFYMVGFGVKAALFPLHVWLPDAHSSAPSPSSAMLSGLVLKVYVIGFMKIIFYVFGYSVIKNLPLFTVLQILSSLAILIGSILAITQSDLKRMLAYSSVTQMGYIFLGIGLNNEIAITGALFHILNHAMTKVNLFLAAGNIINETGIRKISQLKGIGSRMPVTMTAFTVSSLSMVGIPLLSGFNSKWYLGLGSIQAGKPIFLLIIIISSLLNAGYYLPIVISSFFAHHNTNNKYKGLESHVLMLLPLVILSLSIIIFGIYPQLPLSIIGKAAKNLIQL